MTTSIFPWRLLVTPPLPGSVNMAIDEWLMARARETGEGVVRLYSWSAPTISLGRNQTARAVFDPARIAESRLALVRRLTGGRAIVHHREITYAVSAPTVEGRSLRVDYAHINTLLLAALRHLGIDVEEAKTSVRLGAPAAAPCFELPAAGELMARGRKLVGSAQVREPDAYLQHGSILQHDDQPLLRLATSHPMPITPAATLHELLGQEVVMEEFAQALVRAARDRWSATLHTLDPEEVPPDVTSRFSRYADPAWTWRR